MMDPGTSTDFKRSPINIVPLFVSPYFALWNYLNLRLMICSSPMDSGSLAMIELAGSFLNK